MSDEKLGDRYACLPVNARRTVLSRSISTVLALRSVSAEAPLPSWVDILITFSLKMASALREPRCKKIAHAHQVVAGES